MFWKPHGARGSDRYCYPSVPGAETEAQSSSISCPRSHSCEVGAASIPTQATWMESKLPTTGPCCSIVAEAGVTTVLRP